MNQDTSQPGPEDASARAAADADTRTDPAAPVEPSPVEAGTEPEPSAQTMPEPDAAVPAATSGPQPSTQPAGGIGPQSSGIGVQPFAPAGGADVSAAPPVASAPANDAAVIEGAPTAEQSAFDAARQSGAPTTGFGSPWPAPAGAPAAAPTLVPPPDNSAAALGAQNIDDSTVPPAASVEPEPVAPPSAPDAAIDAQLAQAQPAPSGERAPSTPGTQAPSSVPPPAFDAPAYGLVTGTTPLEQATQADAAATATERAEMRAAAPEPPPPTETRNADGSGALLTDAEQAVLVAFRALTPEEQNWVLNELRAGPGTLQLAAAANVSPDTPKRDLTEHTAPLDGQTALSATGERFELGGPSDDPRDVEGGPGGTAEADRNDPARPSNAEFADARFLNDQPVTPGRIVHFVLPDGATVRPLLVTQAWSSCTLNGTVFYDGTNDRAARGAYAPLRLPDAAVGTFPSPLNGDLTEWVTNVRFDAGAPGDTTPTSYRPRTWHWPPRA